VSRIVRGPGDDAAVVRALPVCVTSVDAMIEGVHFRLDHGWASAAEVGHRAMAGALSDLAAMGAEPGEAYVVLGLPSGFGEQPALELVRAADALAAATGTTIAGGDVVGAPALMVSITAVGWAQSDEQLVGRDGARAGDLVGVTGRLGAAGVALAVMEGRAAHTPDIEPALSRARAPMPRLREGRALAQIGAHAMIDISDGLAADAERIARSSNVHLDLKLSALPLADGLLELSAQSAISPWQLAAGSGEDYELCFCVTAQARQRAEQVVAELGEVDVSWIGQVRAGPPGATLSDDRGNAVRIEGFEHCW
jgi:thiamine-monophosphate kinase